jgi:hypothetical protein
MQIIVDILLFLWDSSTNLKKSKVAKCLLLVVLMLSKASKTDHEQAASLLNLKVSGKEWTILRKLKSQERHQELQKDWIPMLLGIKRILKVWMY